MEHQAPLLNHADLVPRAVAGDPEAWEALVTAYTHRVYALLVRQCGDRDLAEELTQATFVKIFSRLKGYDEHGRFEPWLFRIAVNVLRDEMRRRKRQARSIATLDERDIASGGGSESAAAWARVQDAGPATDPRDDPLARMSRDEALAQLQQMVATLSEADREILYLRHTAGLSFPEIAATLEQPLGTVLARGHRALAKLRRMMEDAEGEDT